MTLALVVIGSYLIGAIPFGLLVARSRGVDLLSQGSKNIGATNVGRVMGKWWGVLVFALDFAKGAGPTLAAGLLLPPEGEPLPGLGRVLAGSAAFVGHLFPVYLGFRGGKGVATGAGVILVLMPLLTLLTAAAWGVVLLATRIMSLASIVGAVTLIALRLTLTPEPFGPEAVSVTAFALVASLLVLLRHAGNVRRLLAGTEPRLWGK